MPQPLPAWAHNLLQALEIDAVNIDVAALQNLATKTSDDPNQAHILVGFIAGYAAGLAEGSGMTGFDRAHAASVQFMHKTLAVE